jgi:hypothetical protein
MISIENPSTQGVIFPDIDWIGVTSLRLTRGMIQFKKSGFPIQSLKVDPAYGMYSELGAVDALIQMNPFRLKIYRSCFGQHRESLRM